LIGLQTGEPVLRFTLSKVSKIGSASGQTNYGLDIAAENLSAKKISHATFNFYLFDKNKVRVGQGYIDLSNMRPHETVKMQIMAIAVGVPTESPLTPINCLPSCREVRLLKSYPSLCTRFRQAPTSRWMERMRV
jgi:hypothetical protein